MTIPEVAARLRKHIATVRRWIEAGDLAAKYLGGEYLILKADVLDFEDRAPSKAPSRKRARRGRRVS